jgi:hypothetical protein
MTKTVTPIKGLTITVRPETGRDVFAKRVIYRRVLQDVDDDAHVEQVVAFAAAVTQTTRVDGDLGFEWPTAKATAEELRAALECWLDQPSAVITQWMDTIEAVSAPDGDPDLFPVDEVPEKNAEAPA